LHGGRRNDRREMQKARKEKPSGNESF
jgi:hypothetical protein